MKFRAKICFDNGMTISKEEYEFEAPGRSEAVAHLSAKAKAGGWSVDSFERTIPVPFPAELK